MRRSSSLQCNDQPTTEQGNSKGSKGKAGNAPKQRGGAVMPDATTNQ
jgi:hypothetical protein